jgi:uncharacterized protein (TIGR03067 family)
MNTLIWFAAAAFAAAAPAPAPEKLEDIAKKFQGVWILKSAESDGVADNSHIGDKLKIGPDKLEPAGEETPYTYKLGTADKLRTIDISADMGPLKEKTLRGIFKLEGDTLTICTPNEPEHERPKTFSSSDHRRILILTRQKP